MSCIPTKNYLPKPKTAERYGNCTRTIDRWVKDPNLGFPRPIIINGRWFFALDELEAWERLRAAPSNKKAA